MFLRNLKKVNVVGLLSEYRVIWEDVREREGFIGYINNFRFLFLKEKYLERVMN